MREVGVNIAFNADLNSAKKQYDDFLAYVASHQPTVNGNPIGGAGFAGQTTARTFGGQETIAGPVMAQRGSPNLDTGDERYNYSLNFGGGASAAQDRDERRRQAQYARVDRNWDNAAFARFKQEERQTARVDKAWDAANFAQFRQGERRAAQVNKSWDDAAFAQFRQSEQLATRMAQVERPMLGFGDLVPDATPLGPPGGNGPGAGGGMRAGIRRMLGTEGFRTLGRYLGAYAIAQQTTAYLNQQNSFNTAIGGATSVDAVIGAQVAYQANSPLNSIPILGPFGAAIREHATGEQAALAATQAGIGIDRETYGIRQGSITSRYSALSAAASARGDFAGQREAIDLNTTSAMQQIRDSASGRVTDLSSTIAAITATSTLPDGTMTKENAQKIDAMNAQIRAINTAAYKAEADEIHKENALVSGTYRSERGFLAGSEGRISAFDLKYVDERKAAQAALNAPYEERIKSAFPGSAEQMVAQREQKSAQAAEEKDFQAQQQNLAYGVQAQRYEIGGNAYRAATLNTYAKYFDPRFGAVARNPQMAGILTAQGNTEYAGAALTEDQRKFGVGMTSLQIEQDTTQQNYRNRFLPRTAQISGTISSGADAILGARAELAGHPDELARRVSLIRGNTESRIYGLTHPLDYGNRAEQVGAFVTRGDPGNRAYADLREARRLSGTAGGELDRAASGRMGKNDSPTKADVQSILQKLTDLITAINNN